MKRIAGHDGAACQAALTGTVGKRRRLFLDEAEELAGLVFQRTGVEARAEPAGATWGVVAFEVGEDGFAPFAGWCWEMGLVVRVDEVGSRD